MDSEISEIKNNLDKPIVIVGMMGAGKTHIGKKLAYALRVDFYDSDRLVEEKAGRSVAEIFEQFGEDKFREAEKNTILELLEKGVCVIATGGGAVTNEEILSAIKEKSISVWLKMDRKALWERLKGNKTRPLLKADNPEEILGALLRERESLYAQADLHIDAQEHEVQEMLIKSLYEYLNTDSF